MDLILSNLSFESPQPSHPLMTISSTLSNQKNFLSLKINYSHETFIRKKNEFCEFFFHFYW